MESETGNDSPSQSLTHIVLNVRPLAIPLTERSRAGAARFVATLRRVFAFVVRASQCAAMRVRNAFLRRGDPVRLAALFRLRRFRSISRREFRSTVHVPLRRDWQPCAPNISSTRRI